MRSQKTSAKMIIGAVVSFIAVVAVAVWWGANNIHFFPNLRTSAPQAALMQEGLEIAHAGFSFGVAPGQTARLNISNSGSDQGLIVSWTLLDADGSVLEQGREPVTIAPGKTVSFDVNGDELPARRDRFGRIQMRAIIYSLGGPDTFERNAGMSIEVIDNANGRSALFIDPEAVKGCSNNL